MPLGNPRGYGPQDRVKWLRNRLAAAQRGSDLQPLYGGGMTQLQPLSNDESRKHRQGNALGNVLDYYENPDEFLGKYEKIYDETLKNFSEISQKFPGGGNTSEVVNAKIGGTPGAEEAFAKNAEILKGAGKAAASSASASKAAAGALMKKAGASKIGAGIAKLFAFLG